MGVQELENFRQKYPDYADMDDATLASKLAAKYPDAYGDLPGKVGTSRPSTLASTSFLPQEESVPKWGQEHPTLYGLYGAGKALFDKTFAGRVANDKTPLPSMQQLYDMPSPTLEEQSSAAKSLSAWALPVVGAASKPVSQSLGDLSRTLYEKSIKIPPSVKTSVRDKAIDTGLSNSIPITKGGLNRVKDMLSALTDKMDEVIMNHPNQNAPVRTEDILRPVEDLKDWVMKTTNPEKFGLAKVQDAIDQFKARFGDEITVSQAQELKQATNSWLKKNAYGQLQDAGIEAEKQTVRGLKDAIANAIPEITGVNLSYSELKTLEPALERAVNRTGNWDWVNLSGAVLGTGVGAATGRVGGMLETAALVRMIKSPQVQSRLALALKKSGKFIGDHESIANTITNTALRSIVKSNTGGMSPMEQAVLTAGDKGGD